MLLWMLGRDGVPAPLSPYIYRVLSVAIAIPFFEFLPPLPLTNLPSATSADVLRATVAISFVSYLASALAAAVTMQIAARRDPGHPASALLAGLVLYFLLWYTQLTAVDAVAVAAITLGILLVERRTAFVFLMLACVFLNEKVPLFFAAWLGIRVILHRDDRARFVPQWASSVIATLFYWCAVKVIAMPGHEYQTRFDGLARSVLDNLLAYATPRGLLLNILPCVVLLVIGVFGHVSRRSSVGLFRRSDLLVVGAMLGVALVFTQLFQAGRMAMHAAPLFVVPFAAALRDALAPRDAGVATSSDAVPPSAAI